MILILFMASVFCVNAHAKLYRAAKSCYNIMFFAEAFDRFEKSIERMNHSGLLKGVVLVQKSPLLLAIRNSYMDEDLKFAVEKYSAEHTGAAFFDEIAIAIALREDAIARYLFEKSAYDFRNTPLGKDLLMTAVYFANVPMLRFLEARGVSFAAPERAKAIEYASLSRSGDLLMFLLQNSSENM